MRSTMPLVWVVLAFAFLAVVAVGLPPPLLLRAGEARATLIARGPGGSMVSGSSAALSVCADADMLVLTMLLAAIETGYPPRDRRLRELLDGERFPVAELRLERAALTYPVGNAETTGAVRGDLRLHGITHRLPVEYRSWLDPSGRARLQATVVVNVRAFELESLRELGVTASDLSITADFWLEAPAPAVKMRQSRLAPVTPSARRVQR